MNDNLRSFIMTIITIVIVIFTFWPDNSVRDNHQVPITNTITEVPDDDIQEDIPHKYKDIHIDEKINNMYPENYISRILANENLVRWHHTSFPLKVYIEQKPSLPEYYKTSVENAFKEWQNAASDLISFKFVSNKNSADIICLFPEDFDKRIKKDGNTIGLTHHNINDKKIENAVIEFQSYMNSKPYDANYLKLLAVHEIGHALGLKGHSLDKQDIMYPQLSKTQKITTADINTLRLLYSIIPDICDKEYDDSYRDKFWTTDDILGDENSRLDMTIQQLKDDVGITKSCRYSNYNQILGYKYYKNNDYRNAIIEFKKALEHTDADNANGISYISYMIAYCYFKLDDYDNAVKYADYYYNKESDPERLYFIAYIYKHTNNIEKAKTVLIKTLEKDPKSFKAYNMLGNIYKKENNMKEYTVLKERAKYYFPDDLPIK